MAQFKTAYKQKMVPLDVSVVGADSTRAAALHVGDLVTLNAATATAVDGETGNVPPYIEKAATLAAATHMIALSDITIGGGRVKTDLKDYSTPNIVKVTKAPIDASENPRSVTDIVKKVGLYKLVDKTDILLNRDGYDLAPAE